MELFYGCLLAYCSFYLMPLHHFYSLSARKDTRWKLKIKFTGTNNFLEHWVLHHGVRQSLMNNPLTDAWKKSCWSYSSRLTRSVWRESSKEKQFSFTCFLDIKLVSRNTKMLGKSRGWRINAVWFFAPTDGAQNVDNPIFLSQQNSPTRLRLLEVLVVVVLVIAPFQSW